MVNVTVPPLRPCRRGHGSGPRFIDVPHSRASDEVAQVVGEKWNVMQARESASRSCCSRLLHAARTAKRVVQCKSVPGSRIQIICGPYHGSDSPAETTPTRHYRSKPSGGGGPSSAMLIDSSPIRRAASGYRIPQSSIWIVRVCETFLSLCAPTLRPLTRWGQRDRRPGSCDGQS